MSPLQDSLVEYAFCRKKCGVEDFSEQELIDCSDEFGNHGCSGGGWYDYAWEYIDSRQGTALEENYPYVGEVRCEASAWLGC